MPTKKLLSIIARLERERLTIQLWITCIMLPIAALAIMWVLKVPIIPGLTLFQTYVPLMSLLLLVGIGILMCWHFKMKPHILGVLETVLLEHSSDIKPNDLYVTNFIKLIQNGLSIDARNPHQSNISDEKCSDNKILNEMMVSTLHKFKEDYEACDTLKKIVYRAEIIALIQTGADVNEQNRYRDTPLIIAADCGDTDLVKMLIKVGANVNAKNVFGNTALHRAVYGGHVEIVKVLLKNSAKVNMEDDRGVTPVDVVQGYIKSLESLLARGLAEDLAEDSDEDTDEDADEDAEVDAEVDRIVLKRDLLKIQALLLVQKRKEQSTNERNQALDAKALLGDFNRTEDSDEYSDEDSDEYSVVFDLDSEPLAPPLQRC